MKASGSRTVPLSGVIDSLQRQGHDIINLAIGEPYEAPLPDIVSGTADALNKGQTRYGPVSGIPELRRALARQFEGYDANNVIITNGSKQALYTSLQVLCNTGDEVIIPRPCWVSFCEQIKLAGATPVMVDTQSHHLDFKSLERAINGRTKVIIINSPNNPTGAVYPPADLEKIANLAHVHDLFLISDEAYEAFVYDGWAHSSLFDFPYIRDRLIVAKSFSKTHCMTGFRIGYAAAPHGIIAAMARLQSHLTGNVCTFVQHGALFATKRGPSHFDHWRRSLQKMRDLTLEILKDVPCPTPRGAFYVFPDMTRFLRKDESSEALAEEILQKTHVAVAPGEAFGADGHIRICYAVQEKRLIEGLTRLAQVFHERKGASPL